MLGSAIFGEAVGPGEGRHAPSQAYPYQGLFGTRQLPPQAVRRPTLPAQRERQTA